MQWAVQCTLCRPPAPCPLPLPRAYNTGPRLTHTCSTSSSLAVSGRLAPNDRMPTSSHPFFLLRTYVWESLRSPTSTTAKPGTWKRQRWKCVFGGRVHGRGGGVGGGGDVGGQLWMNIHWSGGCLLTLHGPLSLLLTLPYFCFSSSTSDFISSRI